MMPTSLTSRLYPLKEQLLEVGKNEHRQENIALNWVENITF